MTRRNLYCLYNIACISTRRMSLFRIISLPENSSNLYPEVLNNPFRSKNRNVFIGSDRRHSFRKVPAGSNNHDLIQKLGELRRNGKLTDVKFVFPGSENTVNAHSIVLGASSPVFEVMLCDEKWRISDSEIEIVDIDPEAFELLVEYLYVGKLPESVALDISVSLLHAASKYSLYRLFSSVASNMCDMVSLHNVLTLIQLAKLYDSLELKSVCWKCIELDTDRVLLLEEFVEIPKDLLKEILDHEPLSAAEINLYNGLVRWATAQCQLQGLDCTPENLKEIIGADTLNLIRFPTMSPTEFADSPALSGLLTKDEIVDVFLTKFSTPSASVYRRFAVKRMAIQSTSDCTCRNIGNCCKFCVNFEESTQKHKGTDPSFSSVAVPPCYCRCKSQRYCPSKM